MLTLKQVILFQKAGCFGKPRKINLASGADGFQIETTRSIVSAYILPDNSIRLSSEVQPMIQYRATHVPTIFFDTNGECDVIKSASIHFKREAYVKIKEGERLHKLLFERSDGQSVHLIFNGSDIVICSEYGAPSPIFGQFDNCGFVAKL